MKQLSQEDLYHAYADFVFSPSGQIVLDDLVDTFLDGNHTDTLTERLREIPHPYRAYVEMGFKMLMDGIKAAALNGEYLRGKMNERPSDRPEPDGFTD